MRLLRRWVVILRTLGQKSRLFPQGPVTGVGAQTFLWEVQLMGLEPGSQTQPLEQDRKAKKDAKMTPQTIDLREAAPRTSGLRGRVLRTM